MRAMGIALLFVTFLVLPLGSMAQSGGSLCSRDLSVQFQSDLDGISSCQTFTGTITIANTSLTSITLTGVQLVNGNLLLSNNLAAGHISFPSLQGVTGQLSFMNHNVLSTLNMPAFTGVDSFSISVAPALNALAFPQGLNQVNNIQITDTFITNLAGLNFSTVGTILVSDNLYLKRVNLPNLQQMKGMFYVTANGQGSIDVEAPNLTTFNNGTFRNVGTLNIPFLNLVEGDMSFNQNLFQSLTFESLSHIGGTLTIIDNTQLNNITFSSLTSLGGALSIANNTELHSITGFPQLREVDGTVDITGGFDTFQLPAINDIRGSMNVQTTSTHLQCLSIDQWQKGVVKGNGYTCKSGVTTPKTGKGQPGVGTGSGTGVAESAAVRLTGATMGGKVGRSASWPLLALAAVSIGISVVV
ncbi:hypothetical protein BC937DRAFT_91132 [Endogone sp. FLAS-F59071]|nr:hypothetical protein BC937DRAFT_91132 [Endogone sp. FLAS-F59071]|eukprot:RUS16507.1 hypothetical protein BC937DRAFT_91132 [Endogone sp. FLAS-F59071]